MKICHIITRLILGGAQENTLLTCHGQQLAGHDVTLITGPAIGPEGELLSWAREKNIKLEIIDDMRREINPIRDHRTAKQLRNILGRLKPDIVHTHSSKAGIIGRNVAWNMGNTKVVHSIHGLAFHEYNKWLKNRLYIALERRAAKQCHAIICVADAMTEKSLAAGIGKAEQYHTVYSGMETEMFTTPDPMAAEFRRSLELPDNAILITQVSRLAELKGHEYIIEAAGQIESPNVYFCFVGDGHLREEIETEIDDNGLSEQFRLTGLLPRNMMPAVMQVSDIIVHCSLREGLARALPQAMLAGKPVISFDIDGAREVVNDNTGILLEPEDSDALADAIDRLAGDSALRDKLGKTGRELCQKPFAWQTMVEEIEKVYNQI